MARGLPAGWTAWHSLRIRDKQGFLGEGDFVLAHPTRGLLALEVKGGQVEQRDGRWFQNGKALDESPRDQGERFVRRLLRRLADVGCEPPAFGVAVFLPDVDFDRQPTEDDLAGIVLGRTQLPYLKEALPAVVERALPAPRAATGAWVDQLHKLWGETWIPSLSLGARVRELDERPSRWMQHSSRSSTVSSTTSESSSRAAPGRARLSSPPKRRGAMRRSGRRCSSSASRSLCALGWRRDSHRTASRCTR
jgi:hypothetical protein